MPTITIPDVPDKVVEALEALAKRSGRSVEEEVREMLNTRVMDRASAMAQIERLWASQTRPTTPEEIEAWIREGRP